MDELKLKFLDAQVRYVTAHIQIADTKAAGIIAYMSVLTGYTATRIDIAKSAPPSLHQWIAIGSVAVGGVAVALALLCVLPRRNRGNLGPDTFSWVCIAEQFSRGLYRDRIGNITSEEMQQSLADTVEGKSLVIRTKYNLVTGALWLSLLSSAGHAAYWLFA